MRSDHLRSLTYNIVGALPKGVWYSIQEICNLTKTRRKSTAQFLGEMHMRGELDHHYYVRRVNGVNVWHSWWRRTGKEVNVQNG